jgi:aromatic ring-cleaving dioxygenase
MLELRLAPMAGKKMTTETADIKGYHAHIYYDPATKAAAARVREGLSRFNVQLGSWHDELVGPHLKPMYQVVFDTEEFGKVVPWLMLNREGLDILVHPSTGDGKGDHLDRSLWLGTKLGVNLKAFK